MRCSTSVQCLWSGCTIGPLKSVPLRCLRGGSLIGVSELFLLGHAPACWWRRSVPVGKCAFSARCCNTGRTDHKLIDALVYTQPSEHGAQGLPYGVEIEDDRRQSLSNIVKSPCQERRTARDKRIGGSALHCQASKLQIFEIRGWRA